MVDPCVSLYFDAESVWTHFNNLDRDGTTYPTPQELFKIALSLYDNYSTPKAASIFASGGTPNSSIVSIGESWKEEEDGEPKPVLEEVNSAEPGREEEDGLGEDGRRESLKTHKMDPAKGEKFGGDCTLTRSALFMYEALVSKEVAQAVAEGDIGRVYECIKVGRQPQLGSQCSDIT